MSAPEGRTGMTDEEYKAIRLAVARGVEGVASAHALVMEPLDRLRAELARVTKERDNAVATLETATVAALKLTKERNALAKLHRESCAQLAELVGMLPKCDSCDVNVCTYMAWREIYKCDECVDKDGSIPYEEQDWAPLVRSLAGRKEGGTT